MKKLRIIISCCGLALVAGQSVAQTGTPANVSGQRLRGVPYLGAFLGDVTEARLAELKLAEIRGAIVGRVIEESPAAKAGLKEGDVLLTYRGEAIEGREHVYRLLSASLPGRIVTFGISRDGVKQNVHVTLSERRGASTDERLRLFAEPDEIRRAGERIALEAEEARQKGDEAKARELASQAADLLKHADEGRQQIEKILLEGRQDTPANSRPSSYNLNANRHLLGVTVRPLNAQLAGFFNVAGGNGVLVTEVKPGGLVERAGIKAGDCITALNGEPIQTLQDLTRQIGRASRDAETQNIVLTVVRDRREMTATTRLTPR